MVGTRRSRLYDTTKQCSFEFTEIEAASTRHAWVWRVTVMNRGRGNDSQVTIYRKIILSINRT